MIASSLLSNVVPVLKKDDTCAQALGWMDLFRVSHLPVLEGETYVGLLSDEIMYTHGSIHDTIGMLDIPREMTFVYEDVHMYDVIGVASSRLLSVVPVLNRKEVYQGSILLTDILHNIDKLLCIDDPGGIIVLEVNKIDYSLAEVAQIVEYNEAKVLSCYVTCMPDSNKVEITLKVNTARIEPILDTFIRYRYVIKNTFVSGEDINEEMRDRYGQLLKFMEM
ncbi:CBS domain-containing protein [Butyricimonas faecalis]|jgi:hypothetical protein|uniref:CBS domain-containing protein n=1 Tax=Butyricimonas faecalis TaxID=2093856 RepID=A0A3Q9IP31_9BACT|nr:CBS domain-containing protein [Butyricimonas faecalis]AZS29532.1 CBS domain-containing protein [Butyricimonas faecalis]MBS7154355.1 CBS domain-containing protein [Sanguibacteroides justesenii]